MLVRGSGEQVVLTIESELDLAALQPPADLAQGSSARLLGRCDHLLGLGCTDVRGGEDQATRACKVLIVLFDTRLPLFGALFVDEASVYDVASVGSWGWARVDGRKNLVDCVRVRMGTVSSKFS